MTARFPSLRTALALACVGFAAAAIRTEVAGQERSARLVVQDTGLAGIDRGLRDQGVAHEPRGRSVRARAMAAQADGTTEERLYRDGSVIVKFRDGTTQNAV